MIEPFRIEVPDDDIEDLRRRLHSTRWPDQLPGVGWSYGIPLDYVRELAGDWADGYDWRAHEAELNAFPQFVTTIDGQRIHVIHARSENPDALPLLISHGWPGSIAEFTKVIGPLTDDFHVVAPSLPGYGFSGPTATTGWDGRRIATAWAELMTSLGYERYGAQGGDWGSMISCHLADVAPDNVVGVHVNLVSVPRPGDPDDLDDMTDAELAMRARVEEHKRTGRGYQEIQGTKPQTLAYGLNDSPTGLLAWIIEKFHAWTDNDGRPEDAVPRDALLTNVSIYWFTQTAGSAARLYYETRAARNPLPPVKVPFGVASFPKEISGSRRRWVERSHNLVRWTDMPRGGHFAAMEEPELLVDDVRAFFSSITR